MIFYQFSIYNRWGNKVFECNTPGKGWDGTTRGIAANNAAYVWTCTYQLKGGAIKLEKGTVFIVK